jgi:hypothetical protein
MSKPFKSSDFTSSENCVAMTERILNKIWCKCTKAEGNTVLLWRLLERGVGTANIEEWFLKEEGNRKAGGGRKDYCRRRKNFLEITMMGKISDSELNETLLRKKKSKLRSRLADNCESERQEARTLWQE